MPPSWKHSWSAIYVLALLLGAFNVQGFSVIGTHLRSTQIVCPSSLEIPSQYLTPKTQLARKCLPLLRVEPSSSTNVSDANQDTTSRTDKREATVVEDIFAPLASTAIITAFDIFLRSLFRRAHIGFPSSLAGCGLLFMAMIGLNNITSKWGHALHRIFSPGSALLAKWLPAFFVPSLVTLPLASSMGSPFELAKVATVIVFGFFFTLLTTSLSVLGVRQLSSVKSTTPEKMQLYVESPKKAFSLTTLYALASITASAGILSTQKSLAVSLPAKTLYLLSTTLFSFVWGARLPPKATKIVHPLVTCTCLTWLAAQLIGFVTGTSILEVLRLYKTGLLMPVSSAGAGDILQFMLGPAVVALSCQMYDRKDVMKQNLKEVGTGVLVSSIGGLFGTAFFVRVSGIANSSMRLSLLSRNITSPLAMAIASMLGADISLAVSMVVISGLIGANCGAYILDRVKIKEPVARGLGMGAAAHGLGTAAMSNEPDAFPFAAISMALTASFSTVLVSLPFVRDLLIRISLGF